MRKKYKRVKNLILKAITVLATVLFFVSILALDNGLWTPTIMLVISGVWLIVYGLANGWFEVKHERWGE